MSALIREYGDEGVIIRWEIFAALSPEEFEQLWGLLGGALRRSFAIRETAKEVIQDPEAAP